MQRLMPRSEVGVQLLRSIEVHQSSSPIEWKEQERLSNGSFYSENDLDGRWTFAQRANNYSLKILSNSAGEPNRKVNENAFQPKPTGALNKQPP